MPRPRRNKVPPSAPAQLPESLMRAIRADAASKKKEEQEKLGRRTSARMASKSIPQDVFMSGALGARIRSPEFMDISIEDAIQTSSKAPETEEQEMVPSSIQSEEARLAQIPSPAAAPSTIQRPIVQRVAMPSANWRTQATPRLDSSAIGNFKRRPRQPSILGIGRQDDSSVLSSQGDRNSDPFFDELEDFDPAVVTPLVESRASTRKKVVPEPTSSPPSISGSRKRKRGSTDRSKVLVRRTPSMTVEASHFLGSSPEQQHQETDEPILPPPKRNVAATSRTSDATSPKVWSDTMAPPQSSPSEISAETSVSISNPKKRQQTQRTKAPVLAKQNVPQTRGQRSRALQPISTAQLQNLLPSRRARHKSKSDDIFDLTTMNSENEDEASFIPARRRRATSKRPQTPVKKVVSSKSKTKSTLRDKTNTKSANIPGSALRKANLKPGSTLKPRSTAKIYSRSGRTASGQENADVYSLPSTQDLPDDISNSTFADLDPKSKNELDAIVRKFAEVDEWEMEFEDVENSSGSGSGLLLG